MPFGAWLRGPLREILDDTTATHIVRARGLFNPVLVEQTRREFLSGRGSWALPWTLMMVELWCRGVLDAPARAAPTP
jgi:asparagine synthase (glutamine-hydrolysing)